MAEDHISGAGGSGGQGSAGAARRNQDPTQDAAGPAPAENGAEASGAGYGNNAGPQGEDAGATAEAHPS